MYNYNNQKSLQQCKQQNVITESKVKVAILQGKGEQNVYIIDFHRLFILMDQCVINI